MNFRLHAPRYTFFRSFPYGSRTPGGVLDAQRASGGLADGVLVPAVGRPPDFGAGLADGVLVPAVGRPAEQKDLNGHHRGEPQVIETGEPRARPPNANPGQGGEIVRRSEVGNTDTLDSQDPRFRGIARLRATLQLNLARGARAGALSPREFLGYIGAASIKARWPAIWQAHGGGFSGLKRKTVRRATARERAKRDDTRHCTVLAQVRGYFSRALAFSHPLDARRLHLRR